MKILLNNTASPDRFDSFFPEDTIAALRAIGEVEVAAYDRDQLRMHLAGVDVLFGIWGMPVMDEDLLIHADRLKMICYTCGSVADFVTEAVYKRGIRVLCGNKLFARSVAEGTIGYMLLSQRRMIDVVRKTAEDGWAGDGPSDGLRFKQIGIIGFGQIARYLCRMLSAFDCRVKVCSDWFRPEDEAAYHARKADMDEIFSTCDIVTVHESLREDTYHLIGRHYFEMMKPGALFINDARGAIIVEDDLAAVSQEKGLRAVLDVYEKEPLPMDSPLRSCPNIILFPHKGGPTLDIRPYCTRALIADLKEYLDSPQRFADASVLLENEVPWSYARNMTRHSVMDGKK